MVASGLHGSLLVAHASAMLAAGFPLFIDGDVGPRGGARFDGSMI